MDLRLRHERAAVRARRAPAAADPRRARGLVQVRARRLAAVAVCATVVADRGSCSCSRSRTCRGSCSARIRARDPYPPWSDPVRLAGRGCAAPCRSRRRWRSRSTTDAGAPFPARELIIFLTFCVILVDARRPGAHAAAGHPALGLEDDGLEAEEEAKARIHAADGGARAPRRARGRGLGPRRHRRAAARPLPLPERPLRRAARTTVTTRASRSARRPTSGCGASCSRRSEQAVVQLRQRGRDRRRGDAPRPARPRPRGRASRPLVGRVDDAARGLAQHAPAGRRRACAGRGAPSGPRSTRGRARASRPSTSRSRAAPARSRSGRGARPAAASTPAAPRASSSKKRGRIGRGPTKLMSPRRTFQNCGSSSSCVARSQRAELRGLGARALDELLAEVAAEPALGVRRSACGT